MAFAMWAKPVAKTKLPFFKGFGKALKAWREIFQQAFLRKPVPKTKQGLEISRVSPEDRCLFQIQPGILSKQKSSLQSRVFQRLLLKTTSRSLARELRQQSALRLSSSPLTSFRNMPIMSLVGVTLGVNLATVMDDGNERMMIEVQRMFGKFSLDPETLEAVPTCLDDLDIRQDALIGHGCEGAVYMAKVKADTDKSVTAAAPSSLQEAVNRDEFDLAVKAVFNYGDTSDSAGILTMMDREIVPLRPEGCGVSSELGARVNRLPPHPNIVDMPGYFVDDMLVTEAGREQFPSAMPSVIDPQTCFGRNKTLYLLMKRRACNLREFLSRSEGELTMETRCLMLAQLLAGLSHLGEHGVAHRDLKTNNILVEVPEDGGVPRLEICDFGCCLAEESKSLLVPYPSRDLNLGGNSWLMAPEICCAVPGRRSVLDFRKSDLWAAGAVAYEILGAENPFYPSKDGSRPQLCSKTYTPDQLPPLPDDVPAPVQRLVSVLLCRDPRKRPSSSVAAAVAQIAAIDFQEKTTTKYQAGTGDLHRAPSLKGGKSVGNRGRKRPQRQNSHPSNVVAAVKREREMMQWILGKSLALLCQLTFGSQSEVWDMRGVVSFLFLSRLSYADVRDAVKFF